MASKWQTTFAGASIILFTIVSSGCIGLFGYGNTNIDSVKASNYTNQTVFLKLEIHGDGKISFWEELAPGSTTNLKERSSHQPGVEVKAWWFTESAAARAPQGKVPNELASNHASTKLEGGDFDVKVIIAATGEISIVY